jgi:polar amino acid transport system substrate-binding protein
MTGLQNIPLAILAILGSALFASPAVSADHCPVDEPIAIAAEDAFFPYSGLYENHLRGFAVDVVSASFAAVNCKVAFNTMPYNRCMREVAAGRQLGCFDTTGSRANRRNYIFHEMPLFFGKIMIYRHPDAPASFSADIFKSRTFSVVRGYTYTDAFDADPEISKIEVDSDLQTLALVARRRADYAVVYEKVAEFHMSNSAELISPQPVYVDELVRFGLFISFTRKNPGKSQEIAAMLDNGLKAIHASGTYADIERTWDNWLTIGLRRGEAPPHWQPPI